MTVITAMADRLARAGSPAATPATRTAEPMSPTSAPTTGNAAAPLAAPSVALTGRRVKSANAARSVSAARVSDPTLVAGRGRIGTAIRPARRPATGRVPDP